MTYGKQRELGHLQNKTPFKHSFLPSEVIQEDSQADMTIKDKIVMKAYPDLSVLL